MPSPLEINVSEEPYEASPAATAAHNTDAIQAAINDAHARGGGVVRITLPGVYEVTGTSEPDTVYVDTTTTSQAIRAHLILRSSVFLKLDPGVVIKGMDVTKHVISLIDMDGGGVIGGGHVKSIWDPDPNVNPGTGHGIFLHITEPGQDNINIRIEDIEISHVGSYGLAAQYGDYHNNRYSNLYIHHVGADAIDHKVHLGSTNTSRGVVFNNITVSHYGLRHLRNSNAGIDLRGPAQIYGFWALNFAIQGKGNVGIRFNAGTIDSTAGGVREPASYSSLTGFYIDSGDPAVTDAGGISVHSAESVTIAQGIVKNCQNNAVGVSHSGSGFGHSFNTRIIGITVEGSWLTAFFTKSSYTTFLGCAATGAVDTFEHKRENLEDGQTVFVSPRKFDPAKVQVYKNGVLQTLTTHYTITGNQTITFTSGVLEGDVIDIITPTNLGFSLEGDHNVINSCALQNVTTPYDIVEGTHQLIANEPGAAFGSMLNSLVVGHTDSLGTGKIWIGVHAVGSPSPNGELILGKASVLVAGNVLGQLSFYSSDDSANADGRQAAIKAITSHATGVAASLAFFAGTGTEDSTVEGMRLGHDRGVNIGGTELVGAGNLSVAGIVNTIGLTINDTAAARIILLGTINGTTIGSSGAKMAFYGTAPIIKPTGDVLTALANLGLVGSPTIEALDNLSRIDFTSVLGKKIILYGTIGAANYGLAVASNELRLRTSSPSADFVFGHSTGGVFTETSRITGDGHADFVDITGRQIFVDATNTAAGVTGAQTINKAAGTVNMPAGGTSLVVTNDRCTSNSLVFAVVRTNDSTAIIKNIVPATGSFTIRLNAPATAETSIGFHIINR